MSEADKVREYEFGPNLKFHEYNGGISFLAPGNRAFILPPIDKVAFIAWLQEVLPDAEQAGTTE